MGNAEKISFFLVTISIILFGSFIIIHNTIYNEISMPSVSNSLKPQSYNQINNFESQESPSPDITPPLISDVSYFFSYPISANSMINISALVTDNDAVLFAILYYQVNDQSGGNEVYMTRGARFYALIGPFSEGTIIKYYITAIDYSHNFAMSNNGGYGYTIIINLSDFTPPEINGIHYDFIHSNFVNISVIVEDTSGIGFVTLYYRSTAEWSQISMSAGSSARWSNSSISNGTYYSAVIGPFNAGLTIYYYITASDNSPNRNQAIADNDGLYYSLIAEVHNSLTSHYTGASENLITPLLLSPLELLMIGCALLMFRKLKKAI